MSEYQKLPYSLLVQNPYQLADRRCGASGQSQAGPLEAGISSGSYRAINAIERGSRWFFKRFRR